MLSQCTKRDETDGSNGNNIYKSPSSSHFVTVEFQFRHGPEFMRQSKSQFWGGPST